MMHIGRVYLVGAGPGDPDLLTLKAVKAIEAADVVLVDDLVNPAVLAHTDPSARVIPVGKRGGCVSTPQAFISKLIVSEAKRGHNVVRLKGGDPSIFGRAAEEITEIRAAGIPYEIIPGITSASAAAAALGAPLTDRASGHGVAYIAGHTADALDEPEYWRALVASNLTLVIYMGVTRVRSLVQALRQAGAQPSMPCAIVENASNVNARSHACTLDDLVSTVETQDVRSPALLLLGSAVAAHAIDHCTPEMYDVLLTSSR